MVWTMYGDYGIIMGEHIVNCEHKETGLTDKIYPYMEIKGKMPTDTKISMTSRFVYTKMP